MASTVADQTGAVLGMSEDWSLAAALLGGTRAMRAEGEKYLPRWPAEEAKAYDNRLKTAVLFPAYSRTVQTLAAKPFSKPPTISEEAPLELLKWLQDIDLEGRNFASFAANAMDTAIGKGLGGILIEYPDARPMVDAAGGRPTLADERAAGLRPYWCHIEPEQILGWRTSKVRGVTMLKQLRIMEKASEDAGQWGAVEVEQVRVLEPGKWTIYRLAEKSKDWSKAVVYDEGVTSLGYIPFVPYYGARAGFMVSKSPLIEVAHLNVAHWQSASDQQTILHVARVPILFLKMLGETFDEGGNRREVSLGASTGIAGTNPDSDAKFVEHSGAAIGAGREDLKDLEERMRQAGAELLVVDSKITATQVNTENAVGMCALQRITLDLQDALNLALEITAEWAKLPNAATVTLFNDFGFSALAEASAALIKDMAGAGIISKQTAFDEQKRRGVISADLEWDEEKARMDEEGPALGTLADMLPTDPAAGGAGGAM